MTRVVPLALLAGVLLLISACAPAAGAGALPAAPPVVNVTMTDDHFAYSGPIRSGRTVFVAVNRGHVVHRLELVPLPKDFPPINVQLHGSVRRPVQIMASIPFTSPGQTGSFAVDLPPGRYAFISFVVDRDGVSQALKGMATEFKVH
jgi:hypothetical protein